METDPIREQSNTSTWLSHTAVSLLGKQPSLPAPAAEKPVLRPISMQTIALMELLGNQLLSGDPASQDATSYQMMELAWILGAPEQDVINAAIQPQVLREENIKRQVLEWSKVIDMATMKEYAAQIRQGFDAIAKASVGAVETGEGDSKN